MVFDAPTRDWAGRRNAPTIDVYLYDIREDLRRRERGMLNEYDEDEPGSSARHLPPRHFKLSYLVTAWTQRPEDEHRLLSSLLTAFLRYDALPADLLTGPLAELGLPVPLTVALPPPEDRAFADVWSALGGELKPSIDVVVSAPIDTGQRFETGPPVTAPPLFHFGGSTVGRDRAGGSCRADGGAGRAVGGARNRQDGAESAEPRRRRARQPRRSGAEELADRAAQARRCGAVRRAPGRRPASRVAAGPSGPAGRRGPGGSVAADPAGPPGHHRAGGDLGSPRE